MARRSARLQKRSLTPSSSTMSASWESANSTEVARNTERLPSVVEGAEAEPAPKKSKRRASKKSITEEVVPAPEVAQTEVALTATPHKSEMSTSQAPDAVSASTPKDRTPIKPVGHEMHPAYHHPSTAKVLDEARWLGFQSMGAASAQPKPSQAAFGQATPSKSSIPATTPRKTGWLSSPTFKFNFKSPMVGTLSPTAARILREGQDMESTMTPGRALFKATEFSALADVSPQVEKPAQDDAAELYFRKMATPKGKSGRFSDAHKTAFNKMDSIANHPSAFRLDPNRFKPVNTTPKRTPSKKEHTESTAKKSNTLKRTPSKMDVTEDETKNTAPKVAATPLKRSQSKMDVTQPNTNAARTQSTSRIVPPSRDGNLQSKNGESPAKRVKRTKDDDAASTRPAPQADPTTGTAPHTPGRMLPPPRAMRGLSRPTSRLLSPTKASLQRSQSVKTTKTTSMIPSLIPRSPSVQTLQSPSTIGGGMMEGMKEGIRKTSSSLLKMKSILRTPNRKYSVSPEKIAAGTHMSPPPDMDLFNEPLPSIPATAPVQKRVVFSESTLQRASIDELANSPSPMKARSVSVTYPTLPESEDSKEPGSPVRRLTFGAPDASSMDFSFTADRQIKFGPPSSIRIVAPSNASSVNGDKKRKLAPVEESSDKENNTPPAEEDERSPKKARIAAPPEVAKTPKSASKLPRRTPGRTPGHGGSISKSRLAYLSTPKRKV